MNKIQSNDIINALNWRYAVKAFDATKKVSDADVAAILESARLSPSSYGIEAWKFLVIKNPEIRQQIRGAAWNQMQITDASHLIVVTRRTDSAHIAGELIARVGKAQGKTAEQLAGLAGMVSGAIEGQTKAGRVDAWFAAQTYIALGIMLETAALLGVDACPMEGFDPAKVNEILGLGAKNLAAVTLLPIGYRGDDAYASNPKSRRAYSDVVEVI